MVQYYTHNKMTSSYFPFRIILLKATVYTMQLFAAIVGGNQLNSELSGMGLLIGSRQRLLQAVA